MSRTAFMRTGVWSLEGESGFGKSQNKEEVECSKNPTLKGFWVWKGVRNGPTIQLSWNGLERANKPNLGGLEGGLDRTKQCEG